MATEWNNYVNIIDDMLATAFLTSARNSLTMVCSTLHRETDIAASPVLVMESDINERIIELNPNMQTISVLIRGIVNKIQSILQQYPRIGNKMKLPKGQQSVPFLKVFREDIECIDLVINIEAEVIHQREEIDRYISFWNCHRSLWETTESTFIKRLKATDLTADVFECFIMYYSTLADDISFIDAISPVYFTLMNQNYIKNSILDYIEKWQTLNIKILLTHSFYLIRGIYRYMRCNSKKIMITPRTLQESLAAKAYFERLMEEAPLKQASFPKVLDLFALLDKYQVDIPDEIRQQVESLQVAWMDYLRKLGEADEMLDNNRDEFKKILLHQAEKFKIILKEFLEDFYLKLPTAANM
ncbi:GH22471 [Drosophila grimshawi]|uniref:GH22471 n=1 Tax=Drosophila grimshawi TaxID=7222 RepID=B4K062_DROGR|nr:GH22471 [Drosophila grimshawi]